MLNQYSEKQKLQMALIVITLLSSVKWGVIPWLDWREQVLSQIALSKSSFRSPEKVLENIEIEKLNSTFVTQAKINIEKSYFKIKKARDLSLKLRQHVEDLANKNQIKIQRSTSKGEANVGYLIKSSLQLNFNGPQRNVLTFLSHLEQGNKQISIEEMTIDVKKTRLQVFVIISGWSLSTEEATND
jgi:hypothetical protein